MSESDTLQRIQNGRTDLVWDVLAHHGTRDERRELLNQLVQSCAYYGDVSALRRVLEAGATLAALGPQLGLHSASFHGHWQLCEFLLEQGADVNSPHENTAETPLHSALCTARRERHDLVVRVLLAAGAEPNRATKPRVETGSFMRDCRTRGETALHRAAAFGTEETVDLLLGAGASREARDMNGDTPLGWASWYGRPDSILRRLCFGSFNIHPDRQPMHRAILGTPQPDPRED